MAGTKYYAELAPLTAWDANKVLSVESDPISTGGWKAHVSIDPTLSGNSDAILVTQKAIKTYVDNSPRYTNLVPMPTSVGGWPSGTTFNDVTYKTLIDGLLYPYQYPSFLSFSIFGQNSYVEVGSGISGTKNFVWNTSNSSNVQANSITISDVTAGDIPILSGLANDGVEPYTFPTPIILSDRGIYNWKIKGLNTHAEEFIRYYTVNWWWNEYWGISYNPTLNEAQIKALSNIQLSNSVSGTFSFASGGYKYLVWPTSLTQPVSFKDSVTLLDVSMNTPYTIDIINSYGAMTNYTVYRTFNQLGSSINIIVN